MMRINELTPVFVEGFMPEILEPGKLYISEQYDCVVHLCACGCNIEVHTPIGKGGWQLQKHENGTVTLRPSVGNFQIPCKTHYFITNNRIEWL
jgi:hypothetical protein